MKRQRAILFHALRFAVNEPFVTHSVFSSAPVKPESCCLAANTPRPLVREFHIVVKLCISLMQPSSKERSGVLCCAFRGTAGHNAGRKAPRTPNTSQEKRTFGTETCETLKKSLPISHHDEHIAVVGEILFSCVASHHIIINNRSSPLDR